MSNTFDIMTTIDKQFLHWAFDLTSIYGHSVIRSVAGLRLRTDWNRGVALVCFGSAVSALPLSKKNTSDKVFFFISVIIFSYDYRPTLSGRDSKSNPHDSSMVTSIRMDTHQAHHQSAQKKSSSLRMESQKHAGRENQNSTRHRARRGFLGRATLLVRTIQLQPPSQRLIF